VSQGIIGCLLIGLVAGVLGRLIMPRADPGGVVVTILLGIAGALLAYYLTPVLGHEVDGGWLVYAAAAAGSVVLLALYRLIMTRRA